MHPCENYDVSDETDRRGVSVWAVLLGVALAAAAWLS